MNGDGSGGGGHHHSLHDHDAILKQHQEKFLQHKQWMEQQQRAITTAAQEVHAPASAMSSARMDSGRAQAQQPERRVPTPTSGRGYAPTGADTIVANPQSAVGYSQQELFANPFAAGGGDAMGGQSPNPTKPRYNSQRYASASGGGGAVEIQQLHQPRDSQRSVPQGGGSSMPPSARSFVRSMSGTGSPLNVHNRSYQWSKRKEQKIQEQRVERSTSELAQCTFRPEVHSVDPSTRSVSRSENQLGDQSVNGLQSFLERQENARQLQKDQMLRLSCDGSKWRHQTTKPVEFELGKKGDRIVSLARPIPAPQRHPGRDYYEVTPGEVSVWKSPSDLSVRNPFDGAAVPARGAFSSRDTAKIIDYSVSRRSQESTAQEVGGAEAPAQPEEN